jgi:hypothetical protein
LGTAGGDAFEQLFSSLPTLAAMAEKAASAAGLNFTPSPEETLDGARRRFLSPKARP